MMPSVATLRTLTGACLAWAAILAWLAACTNGGNAQPRAPDTLRPEGSSASAGLPDFAPLVERYGDTVVNVEVVQRQQSTGLPLAPDDPMRDFFRRFGIPIPEPGEPGEAPPARGTGSGFIVSPDGYILTNAHVVAGADEVTVRLTDRREFQAEVVGADARSDVAVLKIDAENLPTVRIGDSKKLRPGEWVLAIGSPFGLENSATAGIVSATSRAVGGETYVPFIQTDVAVNMGNSGGPLFNLDGEVVGINSMIFSRSGGYMGLSFAIPIDVAVDVRDQIIEHGRVIRGRIGVVVQDVNAQLAESFGLESPRGALVSDVQEDSPAEKAGLMAGDVILSVNGEPIEQFGEVSAIVSSMRPGSEAHLGVWRDRKEIEIDVRVAELEEEPARTASQESKQKGAQLGMVVRPLSDQERRQLDSDAGVVVEQVSGPAALAGVQPGDIIVGVNGEPLESVDELREAVEQADESVALLVRRGDAQLFIPVRVG